MKEIIATGRNTEEAIESALLELNVSREDVEIEILETSNKGIFGIFGQKDAKVKVTVPGAYDDEEKVEAKKAAPKTKKTAKAKKPAAKKTTSKKEK